MLDTPYGWPGHAWDSWGSFGILAIPEIHGFLWFPGILKDIGIVGI